MTLDGGDADLEVSSYLSLSHILGLESLHCCCGDYGSLVAQKLEAISKIPILPA